jgi:hypothetical protein
VRLTYAGVGSQKTPLPVLRMMCRIAGRLEARGWVLHSGGAIGADRAFESGVSDPANARIFLPWRGAFDHPSPLHHLCDRAHELARKYHPAYHNLSPAGRKLMARNGYQVLGQSLTEPVTCVICWTSDGKDKGGTGQAICIAWDHDIPVFNLHDRTALVRLGEFVLSQ